MSLDITLTVMKPTEIYEANITHNLGKMADEAGIYQCLWHPEKLDIKYAKELIKPLEDGIKKMKEKPEFYKKFDAKNGWGTYRDFLPWLEKLLQACIENPEAQISVWI